MFYFVFIFLSLFHYMSCHFSKEHGEGGDPKPSLQRCRGDRKINTHVNIFFQLVL